VTVTGHRVHLTGGHVLQYGRELGLQIEDTDCEFVRQSAHRFRLGSGQNLVNPVRCALCRVAELWAWILEGQGDSRSSCQAEARFRFE